MYKNQPIAMNNVQISIPDDALWETTPETFPGWKNHDWGYLRNNIITLNNSVGLYGQFPRVCSINISAYILEKERPRAGSNNFGDYIRQVNTPNTPFSKNLNMAPANEVIVPIPQNTTTITSNH